MNNFIKKLFFYFINALLTSILGIIFVKLCGLFIPPNEYGVYSVFAGIYSLISQIVIIIFSQSILRYYSEYDYKNKINIFYKTLFQLYLIIIIIILILSLFILPLIFNNSQNDLNKILILLFIILFIFDFLYSILTSIIRCKGLAKKELITNTINYSTKILIFLLYFFLISKSISSILIASIAGLIIGIMLLRKSWKIQYNDFFTFDKELIKKIFYFGLPLIGVPIVNYLLSMSDHLIIKILCGDTETGIYSMGYKLASNIFVLISSFIMVGAHPIIMRKFDQESMDSACEFIQNVSLLYFIICIPILIVVLFYADLIIKLFASSSYSGSASILSIVSIGIVLSGYINYTNKPWEMTKQSWKISFFSLIGAVLNVILNFTLIPFFGYKIAAWTTAISYLVVIICSLIGSRKIANIKIKYKSINKVLIINLIITLILFLIKKYIVNIYITILFLFLLGILYLIMIYLVMKKELKNLWSNFKKE